MTITVPSASSKEYLRLRDGVNRQLKSFLKSKGCTTDKKRREAMKRGAMK